jgi:hypothetical protein
MTPEKVILLNSGQEEIFHPRDNFKTIRILWPRDSKVPTIRGKWTRMRDGRILATYTPEELEQCLKTFEATQEIGD